MTRRSAALRSLRGLLLPVTATCLCACTVEVPEPALHGGSRASEPPAVVPDDGVAATDPPRPAGIEVVISLAEWDPATRSVQVGGYASPVVEEGGTCTVELEHDGRTVQAVGSAVPDATTTVCAGLSVDGAGLGSGSWRLVLRYDPPRGPDTSSEPSWVEVPA